MSKFRKVSGRYMLQETLTSNREILRADHLARLCRTIPPAVIAERGYRTIYDRAELLTLGFKSYQARTPGLLIPIWGIDGTIVTHRFRPDYPRNSKKNKPIKYESVFGSHMVLDVLPSWREKLRDPKIRLWCCEGSIKADGLASRGELAVSFSGVWGWRGSNEYGGKTPLVEWDSIALNDGRPVILAFDADIHTNRNVNGAARRLEQFLRSKGAAVSVLAWGGSYGN